MPEQVEAACRVLLERGALSGSDIAPTRSVPPPGPTGPIVAVVTEAGQDALTAELLSSAADLALRLGGTTVAITASEVDPVVLGALGADRLVRLRGAESDEDIAEAIATWADEQQPWAILAGSTASGREIASRIAVRLDAGLTGDAVELDIDEDAHGFRLVAWKAAFGGQLVAAVTATSAVQLATVRPGVLTRNEPRRHIAALAADLVVRPRRRVRLLTRRTEDVLECLSEAAVVLGIGAGVDPGDFDELKPLQRLLDAELACTRKLTDGGWMPHARQVGITGRSIAPRLFIAIGTSGKFNHMVGVRAAGTILAVNPDPEAPVWRHADAGIVAPWQEALPVLVTELERALSGAGGRVR